jgi:hypothetical protein
MIAGMATFVPVPGVCQVSLTGHIGSHKFNQIWHFSNGGGTSPWTAPNLLTLVNACINSSKTNLASLLYSNVTYNGAAAVDLTNATPATAVSTAAAWSGTGAGEMAPSLATMVLYKIADRYRGGKPRTYFPPMCAVNTNTADDGWIASAVTNFQTGVQAMMTSIMASVPLTEHYTYSVTDDPLHHRYVRTKTGLRDIATVAQYVVSPVIRSQRRRMTSAA